MFAGWVFTLFVGGAISAILFSWGTFAPSKAYGQQVLQYQMGIDNAVSEQLKAMSSAPGASNNAELTAMGSDWAKLTKDKKHPWPSTTTDATQVLPFLNDTTELLLANSDIKFA
jgi:hypothetical protein